MTLTLDYDLCMAAGRDAGDANMKKQGRYVWSKEDFVIAADTANELLELIESEAGE